MNSLIQEVTDGRVDWWMGWLTNELGENELMDDALVDGRMDGWTH